MSINKRIVLAYAALATALPSTSFASDSLEQALNDGDFYGDIRYRYEFVDQTGFANDANASTIRTRLGYNSGTFYDFSFGVEVEDISRVFSDNNNDTTNNKTTYPVVADPDSNHVNQLFIKYAGIPDTELKVGRQVIALGNHRFVGHVGWRQNNQTFDAGKITNTSIPDTKITYAFIDRVNRIFGEHSSNGKWDSDSHIINIVNNSLAALGTITGYGYFLDFNRDAPAASNRTYGINLKGAQKLSDDWKFKYYAEYATQSDHGSNTTNYDADYYHLAPAIAYKGITATIGYEVLGSDNGVIGFATPLATLHKFNGVTDKFLTTPVTGLEDKYIELKYKTAGLTGDWNCFNDILLKAQYHDFQSEQGSTDFGSEWHVYVKKTFNKKYFVEAKYADWDADTVSSDTQKFVLGIGIKL